MAEKFDLIVVGSGAGLNVASRAHQANMKVALVDHGPLGGTCLNSGCIPSKILIHPADVVRNIQGSQRIGVHAHLEGIDFPLIMNRMRSLVDGEREDMERSLRAAEGFTWFDDTGEFIGKYLIRVGSKRITAPKMVIACGARASIPSIPGLEEAGYLDNVSVFNIEVVPSSIIILGGGYIGAEFAHFFSAFGSEVTIVGRNPKLLKSEDGEISARANEALSAYVNLQLGMEALRVEVEEGKKVVHARDLSGKMHRFDAQEILVAMGRRPNTDLLKPELGGVETDHRGWIKVDDHLQTNVPGIYALGDVIGKHMFRHTANYEAVLVWHNLSSEEMVKADYHAVPHAVYTYPPVAGVGLTQEQAVASGIDIAVGRANYRDTAKGYAMDEDGFAKAIVDGSNGRILGFHVIGSSAPELVQQITYMMNAESQDYMPLIRSQIIHPSISEVVVRAFGNLEHMHPGEGNSKDMHASGS